MPKTPLPLSPMSSIDARQLFARGSPDGREPRLVFARLPLGAIVVRDLAKPRSGDVRSPGFECVKGPVPSAGEALLVASVRVRAEEHAPWLQRVEEFPEDTRQLFRRHVEERCVREDAVVAPGREVELQEVLMENATPARL